MCEVVSLGCTREETAYHEAGHAAIELMHGHTPQLVIVKDRSGVISGDCFTDAPVDSKTAAWRGEKAVAGVLAQAHYVASLSLDSRKLIVPSTVLGTLVDFFLASPTTTRSCVMSLTTADSKQCCQVNLCGYYSSLDYQHFRIAVVTMTEERMPAKKFINGREPECRSAAEECISNCLEIFNDTLVWQRLTCLAEAILKSMRVTAHIFNREEIKEAWEATIGVSAGAL
jgi:hypothetical protein